MTRSLSDAFKALDQYRQEAGVTSSDVYFRTVEDNRVHIVWRISGTFREDGYPDTAEYASQWFYINGLLDTLRAELPFLHRYSAVLGNMTKKPTKGDMVLGSKHRKQISPQFSGEDDRTWAAVLVDALANK